MMPSQDGKSTLVGKINPDHLTDLGNGFYLADGWVLSAADLKNFDLTAVKPNPNPNTILEQ